MKPISKKILIFILVVVALTLFLWIGSAAYSGWQGYKWQKQTDAFQAALSQPYREDTYGGKTPEETWAMFLDALKKGDVELASKYFVVEKQEGWKITIKKTIDAGKLNLVISNLSSGLKKDGEMQQESKAYYYYEFKDFQTNLTKRNSVVFTLNTYTKVWKVSVL